MKRAISAAVALVAFLLVSPASAAALHHCGSHGTAKSLSANAVVSCRQAEGSAQQMISTYAVLHTRFSQWDTGAGFGFRWACVIVDSQPHLFKVGCSTNDYYRLGRAKHGRAKMAFNWRLDGRKDSRGCGAHIMSDGASQYTLLSGRVDPGESCLDLYDFFKQVEQSPGGGYPLPPPTYYQGISEVFAQSYAVNVTYSPDVLIPCPLDKAIVQCRPTGNSDLGPAGRYDCTESFAASTTVPPQGADTTTFSDQWSCERAQFQGRNLVRDEIFRWSDSISGLEVTLDGWQNGDPRHRPA